MYIPRWGGSLDRVSDDVAHEPFPSCSPPLVRLEIEGDGPGGVVLRGEVDASTSWGLARALDDPDIVRLDCSGVTFFGGAGIRVLLEAARDRRLVLRCPSAAMMRVLTAAGQAGEFAIEH